MTASLRLPPQLQRATGARPMLLSLALALLLPLSSPEAVLGVAAVAATESEGLASGAAVLRREALASSETLGPRPHKHGRRALAPAAAPASLLAVGDSEDDLGLLQTPGAIKGWIQMAGNCKATGGADALVLSEDEAAESVQDCADMCLERASCTAFSVNKPGTHSPVKCTFFEGNNAGDQEEGRLCYIQDKIHAHHLHNNNNNRSSGVEELPGPQGVPGPEGPRGLSVEEQEAMYGGMTDVKAQSVEEEADIGEKNAVKIAGGLFVMNLLVTAIFWKLGKKALEKYCPAGGAAPAAAPPPADNGGGIGDKEMLLAGGAGAAGGAAGAAGAGAAEGEAGPPPGEGEEGDGYEGDDGGGDGFGGTKSTAELGDVPPPEDEEEGAWASQKT
eukprot:TRINITY_DN30965_c0_g1_i1.p1 TRINITY_DN30965_c0_g1~~TRINITY_DN30965_c0_g1_i1.p1  ORF type:complete len:389 (-),score=117.97 TRINITY_DN30965_c0_g1_i1:91-1257(-)